MGRLWDWLVNNLWAVEFTDMQLEDDDITITPPKRDGHTSCPDCGKVGHLRVFYYDVKGRLIKCDGCGYYWVAPPR